VVVAQYKQAGQHHHLRRSVPLEAVVERFGAVPMQLPEDLAAGLLLGLVRAHAV
jgi:hypothetical protein